MSLKLALSHLTPLYHHYTWAEQTLGFTRRGFFKMNCGLLNIIQYL